MFLKHEIKRTFEKDMKNTPQLSCAGLYNLFSPAHPISVMDTMHSLAALTVRSLLQKAEMVTRVGREKINQRKYLRIFLVTLNNHVFIYVLTIIIKI